MIENKIDLLVTFDKNYIGPFKTLLKSLQLNNPQEMYYRLLAPHLLPDSLKKILYLDPDIIVINPLRPLWDTDLNGKIFAAASHPGMTDIVNNINRVRLGTNHDYYNTGVMLIDLPGAREIVKAEELFRCVREHADELILPDQDVFNYLYGTYTLPTDDAVWNYDARNYSDYLVRSSGSYTVDWVLKNTVVLHFCGRNKPWKPSSNQRFATLYKHYMQLVNR